MSKLLQACEDTPRALRIVHVREVGIETQRAPHPMR